MRLIGRITIGVVSALLMIGGALAYVVRQMSRLPANHPAAFVRLSRALPHPRVVACLGASIVHGRVGVSFVDLLARRFPAPGTVFVNAGINGDTAYHALQRLDSVIACAPDDVVVLVGNNDAICTLAPGRWQAYRGDKQLPREPSLDWYRETMSEIVRRLQERTHARIALCSLPVLGEDLDALSNVRLREFNAILQQVAATDHVAYLPVYETEAAFLTAQGHTRGRPFLPDALTFLRTGFLGCVQHYLLGRSFDAIGRSRGLLLTTDLIHPNNQGAQIIADQIAAFLAAPDQAPKAES